ncbi:Adenylate cyclase [hydrothermal vent metagenome]|uniref:Adenylate cyclase n=1 Tax=hydrothermal vent metagenome TaxID=652676 RepID=A0A3B0VS56_9ZZZZ
MIYKFNNFELDTDNYRLLTNGEEISVEPQVFNLIVFLVQNKDKTVTRDEILDTLWKGKVVSDTSINNHIKSARKVLADDGVKQQVIKTIHSRGYQFIAETQEPSLNSTRRFSVPYKKILALFMVVFLVGISIHFLRKPDAEQSLPALHRIAVLPFVNIKPNTKTDYFGFALANQIIGELVYLKKLAVKPASSIRKYSAEIYDPIIVGKELNVDYILTGNYLNLDNNIRMNIELVKVSNNKLIWRDEQIKVTYQNAFELQDIVAQRVIDGLKIEFTTSELNRIKKDISTNPLAYEYYLRSTAYPLTTDGRKLAIEMIKKSIALDGNYAPAYAQLGNRSRRLEQFGLVDAGELSSSEQYYLKALSINPDLMSALAYLSMYYTETNKIEQALKLARKMSVINPNDANTHFTLGYIYRYAGMIDLARQKMEIAVAIDPSNPKFRSLIAIYANTGKYHKALKMTDLYKQGPFTLGWKGLLYRRLGEDEKALGYFNQVLELDKDGLWANVATFFKAYIQNDYKQGLQALQNLATFAHTDGETLYYLSSYYALLNDKNNSLTNLEKAINAGYFNYQFMASNSYFDSIKNDPEFKKLLKLAKAKHLDFKEKYF